MKLEPVYEPREPVGYVLTLTPNEAIALEVDLGYVDDLDHLERLNKPLLELLRNRPR